MSNRLANEKSAYLKQHADNPVNWFPWGRDAFETAKRENKPVLVSIGYSTCHWCHVMEKESFEDHEAAEALNRVCVAIKVDREEHPEVDHFFMSSLHLMSERGGWPLNMFVTPDGEPFFGGTYFPKPVLLDLLRQIGQVWKENPDKVREQARSLVTHLQKISQASLTEARSFGLESLRALYRDSLAKLEHSLLTQFDSTWGGFGPAPKFPRPHSITALLRAADLEVNEKRREMDLHAASLTLKAMAYGGLRDHLRGGFHRYSTDERWLVPHFEKMLYDQALLIGAYSEVYRCQREPLYADIVDETLGYLEAEMRLPEGAFAAAQDADSEGIEGKYFVWSETEIRKILDAKPVELVSRFLRLHSVTSEGNWEGANVLAAPLDAEWAELSSVEMKELRAKLLQERRKRVPPLRDTKVIVSWNAWLASACLRASMNFADRPELAKKLLHSAERTLVYLVSVSRDRKVPHVLYGGETKNEGYLEDYAALAEALQLLSTAKLDSAPALIARQLLDRADILFRSSEGKLKPVAASDLMPELPHCEVEDQDGATPSPLSIFVGAQIRQALFDSDTARLERALSDLRPASFILDRHPLALSHLLTELELMWACVIKVPSAHTREFWAEWTRQKSFGGALLFAPGETNAYELCDLSACFAQSSRAVDAFSEALKRARELSQERLAPR